MDGCPTVVDADALAQQRRRPFRQAEFGFVAHVKASETGGGSRVRKQMRIPLRWREEVRFGRSRGHEAKRQCRNDANAVICRYSNPPTVDSCFYLDLIGPCGWEISCSFAHEPMYEDLQAVCGNSLFYCRSVRLRDSNGV